jgi:hypothetical protein
MIEGRGSSLAICQIDQGTISDEASDVAGLDSVTGGDVKF